MQQDVALESRGVVHCEKNVSPLPALYSRSMSVFGSSATNWPTLANPGRLSVPLVSWLLHDSPRMAPIAAPFAPPTAAIPHSWRITAACPSASMFGWPDALYDRR